MKFTKGITKYIWTVTGVENGRKDSVFENCYICAEEYTEEQILMLYNAQCSCRYTATGARLDAVEYITFDLMENKVESVEREEL